MYYFHCEVHLGCGLVSNGGEGKQEAYVTIDISFATIDICFATKHISLATISSQINFLSSNVHCVYPTNIICCSSPT